MTSLLLDHPLFFSGTLFVLPAIAVEAGFRTAVLSAASLDQDRREQIAASRDALGILLSLLQIAVVMGLIADLDSPRSGFIQVDLRSWSPCNRTFRTERQNQPNIR